MRVSTNGKGLLRALSASAVVFALVGAASAAGLMIDNFDDGDLSPPGLTADPAIVDLAQGGLNVLGGTRRLSLDLLVGAAFEVVKIELDLTAAPPPPAVAETMFFIVTGTATTTGRWGLRYGLDGTQDLNEDVTDNGTHLILRFLPLPDSAGAGTFTVRLRTGLGGYSAPVVAPWTSTDSAIFIPLAGFTIVDLTDIDEFEIVFHNTSGDTVERLAFASISIGEIPEPATITLLGLGLLGSAAASRRRRNQAKKV